jgi:hypothetical protein
VPSLRTCGSGTLRLSGWSYTDIHTNIDLDILILRALAAGEHKVDFFSPTT